MKSNPFPFGSFNRSLFSGLYLTAIVALLFMFSSRDALADNDTWLGITSDYNTNSNWQGYYAPGMPPEGGWGNNAYFSIATPNSTITFSQPNNDPATANNGEGIGPYTATSGIRQARQTEIALDLSRMASGTYTLSLAGTGGQAGHLQAIIIHLERSACNPSAS